MIGRITGARPTAERTLTDRVTLVALGVDSWDDATDQLVRGSLEVVWEGMGSLGSPVGYSSRKAGQTRATTEGMDLQRLRLPSCAPAAVGQRIYLNAPPSPTAADLAGMDPYVITRLDDRSHSVLQRVQVVSLADTETVPR